MLPIEVRPGLGKESVGRFNNQFGPERKRQELLWRRTQDPLNQKLSGMQTDNDRRRRIIHGVDEYAVIESEQGYSLVITDLYLQLHVVSPHTEIEGYLKNFRISLLNSNWYTEQAAQDFGIYRNEDLTLSFEVKDQDEHDIAEGRIFPPGYNALEVEIASGQVIPKQQKENPWQILKLGIRTKDIRGEPEVVTDLSKLSHYFPMQVEIGCGPSIETGIPPLHYFHDLYRVSTSVKGTFIFGPSKDRLIDDIINDPKDFYRRSSVLYSQALIAEPTPFYRLLQELQEREIVVGDIITSNFDGLVNVIGLTERNIRSFDEAKVFPKIDFHPDAKSLLAVGSHADRRRVEDSARRKGLKIIYVDPEGYKDANGNFNPYPLESPRTEDMLVRMTAQQFVDVWRKSNIGRTVA